MKNATLVPTTLWSSRPKKSASKEKWKKLMLVRQSQRENPKVRQKEKKDKQLEKVINLEEEEFQSIKELDVEEVKPILHFPEYIPP